MSLSFVSLCVISVFSVINAAVPPLKTCSRDSSDYSSCLRLALQETWPTIVRGIPELNVPVLDPYVTDFESYNFEYGDVTGKMVVKNGQTYGLSNIKFHSLRPYHSKDNFRLDIDYSIPKVFMEGEYKAEGAIGTFRHNGKGKFNISMEDVRVILQMEGPIVNDRWVIEDFSLTPEVGNMKVWASNLVKGNEGLTAAALSFVNEYWQVLYQGMLPYASKSWNESLKNLANEVFSKVLFSSTFP